MISLTDEQRAAIKADAEQNAVGAGVGDTLRLLADRDALAAELAAIRAAGGEAKVVAWMLADAVGGSMLEFRRELLLQDQCRHGGELVPLCDQRIVAAMAAELAEWAPTMQRLGDQNQALRDQLEAARKQEPVMWAFRYNDGAWRDASHTEHSAGMLPLYAAPPLAGQVSGREWVPVSERLPDHGGPVLVAYKFGGIYTCRRSVIDHDLAADEPMHGERDRPTHWMPLPAAPALLATPSMEVNHGD